MREPFIGILMDEALVTEIWGELRRENLFEDWARGVNLSVLAAILGFLKEMIRFLWSASIVD